MRFSASRSIWSKRGSAASRPEVDAQGRAVWEFMKRETRPVLRGGSWIVIPKALRSSYRFTFHPSYRDCNYGFRVVRDVK